MSELEDEEGSMWNNSPIFPPAAAASVAKSGAALEMFRKEVRQLEAATKEQELLRFAQSVKDKTREKAAKAVAKKEDSFIVDDDEESEEDFLSRPNQARQKAAKAVAEKEDSFVADDDESEDEESEEEFQAKPNPVPAKVVAKPAARIALSDEEDEPTALPTRKTFLVNPVPLAKKKRILVMVSSSSEDEDDDNDGKRVEKEAPKPPAQKPIEVHVLDDDDDDADDGEEEDDGESLDSDDSQGKPRVKRRNRDMEEEEDEHMQVQRFMSRCESISDSINQALRQEASSSDALNEARARELVGNSALALKPYQIAGVNWLSILDKLDLNAVLSDEMGLGKTITSIAFLRLLMKRDGNQGPHLIIAPASTVENWQRELQRWLPELSCFSYNGTQNERREMRREIKARMDRESTGKKLPRVWLCTYTYFERESCLDDRRFLAKFPFEVIVLDEAHAIKDTKSSRYQSLMQLQGRRKLLLTGTPCQNKLDELFALLSFCLPRNLLNCNKQHVREAIFGAESDPARVRRILRPFILRRLKSQVLRQLAPKTEQVVMLDMSSEQAEIYDSIVSDFAKHSKSKQATSESVFTELRKAANHPLMIKHQFGATPQRNLDVICDELLNSGYFGRQATRKMIMTELTQKLSDWDLNAICQSVKSKTLRDMVLPSEAMFATSCKMKFLRTFIPEQISQGHRILLFSQWTKLLDLFEEMLAQVEIPFMRLDGSTAVDTRQELMDEFNAGRAPVFLLSTRAGGLGINLTSADVVILHDLDFNPAIDSQAMDRCHRFGQTKPVTVYKLVTRGTVDESIYQMQLRKTGMNKVLLGEEEEAAGMGEEVAAEDDGDAVLLPKTQDFAEGFTDLDEKEMERMNKQMMQEALKLAVARVE